MNRPYPAAGGTPNGSKFLRDDLQWATPAGGGGSPGGSDTQVQFNDSGAFGGNAGLVVDKSTGGLRMGGASGTVGTQLELMAGTTEIVFAIKDSSDNTILRMGTDTNSFDGAFGDVDGAGSGNFVGVEAAGTVSISSPFVSTTLGDPLSRGNGTQFVIDDANQKTTSNVKHYPDLDIVFTDNAHGPVIKDTSNGHWYRIKVTAGTLGVTDLGTSLP